jgi:hypothetical protein
MALQGRVPTAYPWMEKSSMKFKDQKEHLPH